MREMPNQPIDLRWIVIAVDGEAEKCHAERFHQREGWAGSCKFYAQRDSESGLRPVALDFWKGLCVQG